MVSGHLRHKEYAVQCNQVSESAKLIVVQRRTILQAPQHLHTVRNAGLPIAQSYVLA